jgi:hypothetical protein
MSDATGSMQFPERLPLERLRRHAVATLVPFFLDGPNSDPVAARVAAEAILAGYIASTPKELQLSTQIIALGWSAMACLRAAVAAKNLSMDDVLRLQDNAIALDRSSRKATKALDAWRKERAKKPAAMTAENLRWDEGAFQLATNQALEKLMDANARVAAYVASLSPAAAVPAKRTPRRWSEQIKPAVAARRVPK